MKIAGLVTGILLMVLSGITFIICLMLPSMTHNRINFKEAFPGLIVAVLVFFVALIITGVSAIFVIKGKKAATEDLAQEV
jgi:hypothetical protein